MTWFFWIIAALLGLVAGLVLMAARKPDMFRVERRTTIGADAATIFALIDDLEQWDRWSPWAHKDPAMRKSFGTLRKGQGASMAWDGNKQVGRGRMSIMDSRPPDLVSMRLDFEAPFKATNFARFTLQPEIGGTEVVWSMEGPAPLISKIMDMLMNMDRMIGRDFEAGLANLKSAAEA